MILHIPHGSLKLPHCTKDSFLIGKQNLNKIKQIMCDYTSDIYCGKKKIKCKYSRLFVDMERFEDDKQEPMAKLGMGMIYTHSHLGEEISKPTQKHIKKAKIEYHKHHKKLDRMVQKELLKYNKCLIVDCHSFSDELAESIFKMKDFPDICIGYDNDFKDAETINLIVQYFKELGYSVKENYPYSGSMVANVAYKNKDTRVKSVMIELNKRIYLNGNKKNKNYKKLKLQIKMLLKHINKKFYGEI